MRILDEKFVKNKVLYMGQCFLAVLALVVVLLFLDIRTNAVTIAALGSTSFIVFTMPGTKSSNPRFLIGGYIVAITTGSICHFLTTLPFIRNYFASPEVVYPVFAAVSVGLAIFLMVITNTEHPPAGGVALGLVINDLSFIAIIVVLVGVCSLVGLRALLRPMMINLL